MSSKQPILLKVAGLCGVLVPVVTFTFIALAVYYSPWFSWTENWLSDMNGVIDNNIASVIFNIGFALSGIIGFLFAIAIWKIHLLKTRLGHIGILILIFDMSALCAIGVFQTGYLHILSAHIFFFLVGLSLISIGIAVKKSHEKKISWLIILLGLISLCSYAFFFIPQPWGGNAVVEMLPIISISIFSMIFGIYLLKGKFDLEEKKTFRENRE